MTLEDVKEATGVREADLSVAMLQALEEDLYVRLALCEGAGSPFCDGSEDPTAVRGWTRTSGKGALPSLEVLCDLGHLDVGIELLDLVEDMVLVVVAEVVE